MKLISFVLILVFNLSLSAQTYNKKDVYIATDACKISMSKEEVTSDKLILNCDNFLNGEDFEIESFKLKLPNHATLVIEGSSLNEKAKRIIKKEKGSLNAVIFDIKRTTSNSKVVENNLRGIAITIED